MRDSRREFFAKLAAALSLTPAALKALDKGAPPQKYKISGESIEEPKGEYRQIGVDMECGPRNTVDALWRERFLGPELAALEEKIPAHARMIELPLPNGCEYAGYIEHNGRKYRQIRAYANRPIEDEEGNVSYDFLLLCRIDCAFYS